MEIDLRLTSQLSEPDTQEVHALAVQVWGPPEEARNRSPSARLTFTDIPTCVLRVCEEGKLVSFVGIVERSILIDGQSARAAGISGMMTHPRFRRRGYGSAAMRRATDFILEDLRAELALLLSSEMAVPFYMSLGWQVAACPVLCEQPSGTLNLRAAFPHEPPMIYLTSGGQAPAKAIDLCGLPW